MSDRQAIRYLQMVIIIGGFYACIYLDSIWPVCIGVIMSEIIGALLWSRMLDKEEQFKEIDRELDRIKENLS